MLKTTITLLTTGLLLAATATAEVYSWKDSAGNTIYSDQKPSSDAKPAPQGRQVNYYSAKDSAPKPVTDENKPLEELATLTVDEELTENAEMSEEQCQQQYRTSCERVKNWMKYAKEACTNDRRCSDPDFLERKYRPRSAAEIKQIANRAANRKNRREKEIALFLSKKYTNYCEEQAKVTCKKADTQCNKDILAYCEDPRGLKNFLASYDSLNEVEKKAIIEKARKLVIASDQTPNYDKIIANVVDLIVTKAVLGI